jgi:hypothetical protein
MQLERLKREETATEALERVQVFHCFFNRQRRNGASMAALADH